MEDTIGQPVNRYPSALVYRSMYSWRTSLRPRDDTRSFARVDRPLIGRDSRYTVVELERPRCKVAGPVKVMLTVSTVLSSRRASSSSFLPSKKKRIESKYCEVISRFDRSVSYRYRFRP